MNLRQLGRSARPALLGIIIFTLLSHPMLVAAAPSPSPLSDTQEQLVQAGDAYITHTGQAFVGSLKLAPDLGAAFSSPVEDLDPATLAALRTRALAVAEDASAAIGSVEILANAIETIGPNLPPAVDPVSHADLPDALRSDLSERLGYSSSQIGAFNQGVQDQLQAERAVASTGLPADVVAQLQEAGLSSETIQALQSEVAQRGLARTDFNSQLDQFRSSQDELADARTSLLLAYVQLVVREVAVRQAQGLPRQAVAQSDLDELAQDQLRLLVHSAQLQALWGDDPNLDKGEGQWWFVERYAARAAQRTENIILDTQNTGLIVDLYLELHFSTLATAARSGGAAYAKPELDGLAELLATLSQSRDFLAETRTNTHGLAMLAVDLAQQPALRSYVSWPLGSEDVDRAAAALETRLQAPPAAQGKFPELNEDNNSLGIPFVAELSQWGSLHPDLVDAILKAIQDVVPQPVLEWLWAILSGQTENWIQLALNIGLSIIPVLGSIPDVISLIVDPSVFVKAVSVLGIVFSLGDVAALFGITIEIGAASFVGDAASAVTKAAYHLAESAVRAVLDALKFDEAFKLVVDLNRLAVGEILARFGRLGDNAPEARQFFEAVITGATGLWDNFAAFAKRVGTRGLREGLSEGDLLVGRILKRGLPLSDETIEALARIGDDLAEAGIRLSDDAAEGLGVVAERAGGDAADRFVAALRSNPGIGDDLLDDSLEALGRAGGDVAWTEDALSGVENVLSKAGNDGPRKVETLLDAVDDPEIANKTFRILKEINTNWSDDAIEGVARLLEVTPGQDIERVMVVFGGTSKSGLGETMFRRIKLVSDANFEGWPSFAAQMTGSRESVRGSFHVLDFIEDFGIGNVDDIEEGLTRVVDGENITRVYDVVSGPRRYELKNVTSFTSSSADQLTKDLKMLSPEEAQNLKWVFRGPENDDIVSRFIATVKKVKPEWYRDGIFTESNIVFFRNSRPF